MKNTLIKTLLISSLLLITSKNAFSEPIGCDGYTTKASDLHIYSGPSSNGYNLIGNLEFKAKVNKDALQPDNRWDLVYKDDYWGWQLGYLNTWDPSTWGEWKNKKDSRTFSIQDSGEYCTIIRWESQNFCNNRCFTVQKPPTITTTSLYGVSLRQHSVTLRTFRRSLT